MADTEYFSKLAIGFLKNSSRFEAHHPSGHSSPADFLSPFCAMKASVRNSCISWNMSEDPYDTKPVLFFWANSIPNSEP